MDWFYEGKRKDVIVKFQDGTECVVNMLAGSQAFKSSMWHEYEGVIADFSARIDRCRALYVDETLSKDTSTTNATNLDLHSEEAVNIVRLVCDTYAMEYRQQVKHVE